MTKRFIRPNKGGKVRDVSKSSWAVEEVLLSLTSQAAAGKILNVLISRLNVIKCICM